MRLPPFRLAPLVLAAALLSAPAAGAGDIPDRKSGTRILVAGAGLALLAGGGALAYHQNREADRDMDRYRRSAFTENTAGLRRDVEAHQRLTWAGLAGAALGGILIVVSF
jgi:hypothetical protein